jgi:1-acyl-sn-glycerol-3-phosphate acyltransferase
MYFLARSSLFGNKFFRMLFLSLNAMSVERDSADIKAMREVISYLKQGRGFVVYPEATRSDDGRIRDFKAGVAILAKRANVSVVPALIDGAFECWPRDKKLFIVGSRLEIHYGRRITPEQMQLMDNRQLAGYLTERVRQMQNRLRIRQGKKPFDYGGDCSER